MAALSATSGANLGALKSARNFNAADRVSWAKFQTIIKASGTSTATDAHLREYPLPSVAVSRSGSVAPTPPIDRSFRAKSRHRRIRSAHFASPLRSCPQPAVIVPTRYSFWRRTLADRFKISVVARPRIFAGDQAFHHSFWSKK